jgi:predicted PurR-regulated permease PerM
MIRRRPTLASLVTTLIVSLLIVVPLVWLILMFQNEAARAYREVQAFLAARPPLPPALRDLPGIGPWLQLHWAELIADPTALRNGIQQWISSSTTEVSSLVGGVGRNVAKLFLALFAMFFFLRDGARFFSQMRAVLEGILGPRVRDYLKAIGDTTKAVVYALALAALAQGFAAGLGYWAAGIRAPVLVGAITALAALIPFGAPVVWGGLTLWLLVTGHIVQGVGLGLWGILVVSWADNVVRPLVISNATSMPFILVVFGVLGGVISFGLVGLFIGPVVLAVALAIWREWLEHRRHALQVPPSA